MCAPRGVSARGMPGRPGNYIPGEIRSQSAGAIRTRSCGFPDPIAVQTHDGVVYVSGVVSRGLKSRTAEQRATGFPRRPASGEHDHREQMGGRVEHRVKCEHDEKRSKIDDCVAGAVKNDGRAIPVLGLGVYQTPSGHATYRSVLDA